MKTIVKAFGSLLLFTVFLFACFVGVILIFGAIWLHTYKVFTRQTPVAVLSISEAKTDSYGKYADVTLRQIKGRSPLTAIFNPYDKTQDELDDPQEFKLYGDYVELGGPIMKFEDFLTLLNFQTVYKVALIRGTYEDETAEKARPSEAFSYYEINGGYEDWRSVYEEMQNPTSFRGRILDIFIDSVPQLDPKGVPVISTPQELTLCITDKGFLFCD